MDIDNKFIIRDYEIADRSIIDIIIPAAFLGIYRDHTGKIFVRAVSDTSVDSDWVLRYEFMILPVGVETAERIAYSTDCDWGPLGILGSDTVYVRHLFE